MDKTYYESVTTMEQRGVDPEYILGWQCGYLGNPPREEQRSTEAYTKGYEDGRARTTAGMDAWAKAKE